MSRPFSYMPVLKWKRGEAAALRDLFPADKTGILPLAEVVPAPWDWEEEAPAIDLDAYLKKVARDVSNYWGTEDEILVDLSLVLNDTLGPTLPVVSRSFCKSSTVDGSQ